MSHPHTMTAQASSQHRALAEELRQRTDRVITGISLVPTIGEYDPPSATWNVNVGGELRITYKLVSAPEPQIVILQLRPPVHRIAEALRVAELAGATR